MSQMEKTPHTELEVYWRDMALSFDGGRGIPLTIETKYRPIKRNNEPSKSKKTLINNFHMKYCPICGTKFKEDGGK